MINSESTDKEILDHVLGGITVRDTGASSFMRWVAAKIDGAQAYKASTQEILGLLQNAPLGKIPDSEKIRIIKKLLSLDIKI